MALHSDPVMVYAPTCLNDFLSKMDCRFCNKIVAVGFLPVVIAVPEMSQMKYCL